jgi:NAD(P)H-hydrate epimerase
VIPTARSPVPTVTAQQMAEVDRIMIDDLGITLPQMMENAGRNLARLASRLWSPASVTILAGTGGNAGGALVAARHLSNRGVAVTVTLAAAQRLRPVPALQLAIADRMGIPVAGGPASADLIIDGLIGYSLAGDPRDGAAELIDWANAQASPILALDVPSGLDSTTGRVGSPCISATATLTLALPKAGMMRSPHVVGALYLADISVPRSVYAGLGIDLEDPFADGPVVAIPT